MNESRSVLIEYIQNCRPDRTVQDAIHNFAVETNSAQTIRTKSEIIYQSDGTKIETRDADGNRLHRHDSMSADPPSMNNICSLVQDFQISNAE